MEAEGKIFSAWQVQHLSPVAWPSAIESVPRAFRAQPHGDYRKLLDHALDRPACGEHTARESMNAIGEAFLVGGAVRDAIVPNTHRQREAIDHWLGRLVGQLQDDGFVRVGEDGRMDAASLLRPLFREVIDTCLALRKARQQP